MEIVEWTWTNRLLVSVIVGLLLGGGHALVVERSKLGRVLALPVLFSAMLIIAGKGLFIASIVVSALAAMAFLGMQVNKRRRVKFTVFESSMAVGLVVGVIGRIFLGGAAPAMTTWLSGVYVGYAVILSITILPLVFALPAAFILAVNLLLLAVFAVYTKEALGVSFLSGGFILSFFYGLLMAFIIEIRLMWDAITGAFGRAKKLPSVIKKITRQ